MKVFLLFKLFLSMVVAFPDGTAPLVNSQDDIAPLVISPEDFAPRNPLRFISPVVTFPEKCAPYWIKDGFCDNVNNNAECNWDGGDCCNNPATNWDYFCSPDCECLDPSVNPTTTTTSKTTTIPARCYLWNGKLWTGIEPANPVNSVCGRNLCLPCDIWITIANIKDKEFYIGKNKNNFDEAVQICGNEGGKLFEPRDPSITEIVTNYMHALTESFWLGIHDKAIDKKFVYASDDSPIEWNNWQKGQPNNYGGQQECAVVRISWIDSRWDDRQCNDKRSFICIRDH